MLAPPGTGKTELLAERLANAANSGVNQKDMLCLTFTNRAAANMLERVERKIGKHKIFIGNLHSWCSLYLHKEQVISQNVSLLDEEDTLLIIDELKSELQIELKYKIENATLSTIDELESKIKAARELQDRGEIVKLNTFRKQKKIGFNDKILLEPSLSKNAKILDKELEILCNKYEIIKKDSFYIDFDDLLTLSYSHLLKNTSINIPWIQIDEVQDLNPLQWAIVEAITDSNKSHRIFFGDYEQAIFSFMGAKLDSLSEIRQNGAKVHYLHENFRSPQYLLDLFNAYAKKWLTPDWKKAPKAKNKKNKNKNSLSLRGVVGDPYGEAEWIISKKLPHEPKNTTAILVRSNNSADLYANCLNKHGLKYFKVSGDDLFRRKEVKDVFAFFNILIWKEDRKSWTRVLWRYAKIRTLKESRKIINEMFSVGLRPLEFFDTYPYEGSMLDQFCNKLRQGRIVVFDTETTGLNTEKDDIIQIAAIEIINGKIGREFEVFINTEKDITESEKIHHISKSYLNENAIEKKKALSQFLSFVGNDVLVAHNIKYDTDILHFNLKREGLIQLPPLVSFFDSIELCQRLYPDLHSYKLEYLIEQLNIEGENSHNALDDVRATVNLLLSLEKKIYESREQREIFIEKHKKFLANFKSLFSPIYNAITSEFSNDLPLDEVVSLVISYMDDNFPYKIEEHVYEELSKLTRHMKKTCRLDNNLLNNLKRHIPEYVKYTEVDLVLGDEKIFIATIHKAKGLEFENVIIPEVREYIFPHFFSKKQSKINEDARLLYVAMTRAKTNLLITFSTRNKGYAQYLSRFIEQSSIKEMFNYQRVS